MWPHIKKWLILFSILVLPYLIVQIVENATHNILTLGYFEKQDLVIDSVGNSYLRIDSAKVPQFKLLNQDKEYISNESLIGYNYIINFFFTSCPTICPATTLNLLELQRKIKKFDIQNFKIISISVDPTKDTPEKMRDYALSMGIDLSNWELLTGLEDEIYDIVRVGFMQAVGQDSLAPGGVFHSSSISIIDYKGYIRTGLDKKKNVKLVYDGTLYSDIKLLMDEIQRLSIMDYQENYDITTIQ
tara:strand:+ start:6445 stop:7176 length:732 start_codon:yes stop_codon:yes gene_type:complete